jgi:predicted RNase H-like nuclease
MKYTAGQAAKATGVATSTITNALKSGKISGEKDENGAWRIDPSELHRVYPPLAAQDLQNPSIERDAIPKKDDETEVLRFEVERLRETIKGAAALDLAKQAQIEDLRARLDDAAAKADRDAEERRKLTAILIDQRPAPPANENPSPSPALETPPAAAPEPRRGGFWSRLLGR